MILCLTGFSCTGKTSVSTFFVEKYGYRLISIRNVSHELAIYHGYSRTREWLNNTTIEEYLRICREKVISMVRNSSSTNIIIDDLFDIRLWNFLVKNYKSVLFNLWVDDNTRINRMCLRESLTSFSKGNEELRFLDEWKIRFGINDVISSANYNIDVNNKTILEVVQEILSLEHMREEK